jgi:DNA primase
VSAPIENLAAVLSAYQAALPGSLGEEYLAERGIPLALAQQYGLGYSAPGRWAHRTASGRPVRDWKYGRIVFPHTTPAGQLVNLYGRAVGNHVPKELRHDHLPGAKGYFHAAALQKSEVYVCEGPFDALSLCAASSSSAVVAIFGVQGWRPEWFAPVRKITFALDADPAGQSAWRKLARQLALRGKQVRVLPPEAFGAAKDLNEAWVAGSLRVD